MREYFALQYRLANRHMSDFGLPPLAGYILLSLAFVGLSAYLFYAIQYATYLYPLIAISLTTVTGEANRVRFLRLLFSNTDFFRIRLFENTLLVFPFMLFLCYQHEWIIAAGLIILSSLLAILPFESKFSTTFPTPFYRYPFEFTAGFRKNFVFVFFAYFLLTMAVLHDNVNLGVFSLMVILFTCLSYYTNAEPTAYVWIFSMTAVQFLFHKIKVAVLYSAMLCFPVLMALAYFFSGQIAFALVVFALGLLYILATLLGKYAFFPSAMNLPQGIVLAISFSFPPLLLFIIPYYYSLAVKHLKPVLE
jgi:ABC-type multidrug transport system fused ATPase/permease subunit